MSSIAPFVVPHQVLVVDDDLTTRRSVAETLENEGYAVATAADGQEGLRAISYRRPALVLLDMLMPVMDGWEFARRLSEQGIHVPVAVMTSATVARRSAEEIGAAGYLVKPFAAADLLDVVERLGPHTVVARKQADEMRARLAALVESSGDAIVGTSLDGTVTNWNSSAERIYGYTAEEMIGRPIDVILPAYRVDQLAQLMERLRRGEWIDQLETVLVRKGGEIIEVSLSISPIRDKMCNIVGAASIGRDITERKVSDAALAQTRELEQESRVELARLEGVVLAAREYAHRVNNVLAHTLGAIEIVRRRGELSASSDELVDSALASLITACQEVSHFQQVVRVAIKDTPVGPALDLERSIN